MAKETCLSFGVILKGHSWQWLMRKANKINAFPSKFKTNWNRVRKQGQRKWKSFSATIRNSLGGCGHRILVVIAIQSLSHNHLFVTPWTVAHQASLPFTISRSLLKLMSTESVMPSNHRILCHLLLLLPSVFPSIWGHLLLLLPSVFPTIQGHLLLLLPSVFPSIRGHLLLLLLSVFPSIRVF